MGQSTSGTSLTTTAVAATRRLTCKIYFDWDNVGFSDNLTGWYDETQYLKSLRGNLQALNWQRSVAGVGGGVSNSVDAVLRNPDLGGGTGRRFSPSNASGPLYAKIGGGKIYMVRAAVLTGFYSGSTPERLRQITGYITAVSENTQAETISLEIRDRGVDSALCRNSTALYQNTAAKVYLDTLVTLTGRDPIASGDRLFDVGAAQSEFQWLDDETIWDEIAIVAEAQAGRIWFDKDGDLHFDDSTHWVKGNANAWDDPTTYQATFTVASFADLEPVYDTDSIWNHIIVEYSPRYRGWEQPVYTASEIITVAPSESNKVHRAQFHNPVVSAITPVAETDYMACTGGGVDITDKVTVSMTAYGASAKLLISNSSTEYTAYLTTLQVRGTPLVSDAPIKYETEDATSIGLYGRRTWTVRRNPYIQNEPHAKMVANFLLSRFKDPIQIIRLRKVPARPWLEPGDRILVTEASTGIDDEYLITDIDWQYRATSYTQEIAAIRVSDLFPEVPASGYKPYFVVGTAKYGSGPIASGYGLLFW